MTIFLFLLWLWQLSDLRAPDFPGLRSEMQGGFGFNESFSFLGGRCLPGSHLENWIFLIGNSSTHVCAPSRRTAFYAWA